jgi:hypothetical protein
MAKTTNDAQTRPGTVGELRAIRKLGIAWLQAEAVSMRRRLVVSDNGVKVGFASITGIYSRAERH